MICFILFLFSGLFDYEIKILTVLYVTVCKNCNGIKTQGFRILQFLKSEWDLFEKEEVAMENNSYSVLKCAIKCSLNVHCGGSTYHQNSGKCEMGMVIII